MFDDFYGLKGKPFQLTPDATFYFESGTHRKALSYLSYGLAQGEGFVVITGEVGAGKSTLVAHLMATIDPARLTAAQVVTSSLDGEEIIHVIAQAFGLEIEGHDKATALGAIESFLHEEARAGRRCLLVVDEVQNLSISALEELRMLSNFQLGAHPLLQTLLLGQPEFRDLIQHSPQLEQLRQRVIAAHHLDAMEPAEVQPYVEHRLSKVGWQGNPSFDQRVFSELYEASGGVPRKINQIFNRLMLLGAVEERTRIDAAMLQQILAELADDTALPLSSRRAKPAPAPVPGPLPRPGSQTAVSVAAEVPAYQAVAAAEAGLTQADFDAALADRDAQIAELQQAVLELANGAERHAPVGSESGADTAALNARIEELEARLIEQEQTVRHTLAMLVEWLEADEQIAA
ncbi:MAG: XrtA/PEP-CTERM system-associated ATPase [Novosphingobium sp.]